MDERLEAVQRMQDYILENIHEEITLQDLAKISLFSPWYSHRLFKSFVGINPAEYIRKLRLSDSAMRLKKEHCQVINAALDSGFDSTDGYTRAFHKEFGCNPGEYVKNPIPIPLFIPYGVKFREFRKEVVNMENLQNVFVQVIKKSARKVIIKRGIEADNYFDYCGEVGCDVWGMLMSMDSLCGEPVCLWLPEGYRTPGTSIYVQGVEVDSSYNGIIPEGFEIIDLPESEYVVFQGEPFKEEDYAVAIESVECSMSQYDPSIIGYVWNDESPRIQLEPRGNRGYIEMKAVKPEKTK